MTPFASLKACLRDWRGSGIFSEPLDVQPYERLRQALRPDSEAGPADLAVLLRHVLRHQSKYGKDEEISIPRDTSLWPAKIEWEGYGCHARLTGRNRFAIEAGEWRPEWLQPMSLSPASKQVRRDGEVLDAAERHDKRHPRFMPGSGCSADPAIQSGFADVDCYLSHAQAETIRCVMLSPAGCVHVIVMPTGSGKSLVGLSAALLGKARSGGLTVVVVPTTALAFDQVAHAEKLSTEKNFAGSAINAWRSGLSQEDREEIRERIRSGRQRILFVSPESLVGTLRKTLTDAATQGLINAFVVDEAHLVSQWGASFRPEFQTMAAFWRILRAACPQDRIFKTLLMTATLTSETYRDLQVLFDTGDDTSLSTLAAVHLRPEPDYFMAYCRSEEEKRERVIETLAHSPRPAILYVTKVEDARKWHQLCLTCGWQRTGLVHGECTDHEREKAITRWRNNDIDLMVATSAFGVGMDKGDVRLVLHACVPETLDRFYQEVGRGGRDGTASVSIMLWTDDDSNLGERMSSPQLIGDELGLERWRELWTHREPKGDLSDLNLRRIRPGNIWDSKRNLEWNLRTLLMLVRAKVIQLVDVGISGSDKEDISNIVTATVRLLKNSPISEESWDHLVGDHRQAVMATAWANWQAMRQVLGGRASLAALLRKTYIVAEAGIHDVLEVPPGVGPEPPRDIASNIGPNLLGALGAHSTGNVFILYRTAGANRDEVARRLVDALALLAAAGVREISLPASWRERKLWESRPNPIPEMLRRSPERFLITRDPDEDKSFAKHPGVPRISFVPPDHAGDVLDSRLLHVERPLHLILVPEECLDPGNPLRKVGETGLPAIRLEILTRLLKS
jgi:ATP-dependent DNA helicase RecQ